MHLKDLFIIFDYHFRVWIAYSLLDELNMS